MKDTVELAKIIWDYHQMHQKLKKADCILVLGSNDLRVADRSAELYLKGYAPYILFSGGLGRTTQGSFVKPEADLFAERSVELGVPKENIIVENKSTNTSENVIFSKELIEKQGLNFGSFILVQKPYMERRTYATFLQRWPGKDFIVTSPNLSFEEYVNEHYTFDFVVNMIVGDLQRIKLYAEKGYSASQEIPDNVWQAYEELVKLGYDKQLVKETAD